MLKMFQRTTHAGGRPEFWGENWAGQSIQEGLRFCSVDPLKPILQQFFRPGRIILEGGCGLGQYVVYYGRRGCHMLGIDFAVRTLDTLKQYAPEVQVCAADVKSLPFPDNSIDLYFSGGVVEHFEGGPYKALAQAHRVLKKDGVLIISVPFFNLLRKLKHKISEVRNLSWQGLVMEEPGMNSTQSSNGWKFWQYAYERNEFRKILQEAGFSVVQCRGFSIVWGLYEVESFRRLFTTAANRLKSNSSNENNNLNSSGERNTNRGIAQLLRFYLKKVFVAEEDCFFPLLPILRLIGANMMLYVCYAKK